MNLKVGGGGLVLSKDELNTKNTKIKKKLGGACLPPAPNFGAALASLPMNLPHPFNTIPTVLSFILYIF